MAFLLQLRQAKTLHDLLLQQVWTALQRPRRLPECIWLEMNYMLRRDGPSALKTMILAATLLASPCALFGQHGGGGGHIGGPAAGGGGLSGGNRATGIENKDDLRSFHEIMAVQATSEQKIAYAAMLKSTAIASIELKAFIEQLRKDNNTPEVASHDKTLEDAIETARMLNRKFVEGFSEAQKSGLKEITKRLAKTDWSWHNRPRGWIRKWKRTQRLGKWRPRRRAWIGRLPASSVHRSIWAKR